MGLSKKEKRDFVPAGEEFVAVFKAVYVGSVPIDVTTGVDILKAAATILMGKSENIKKVWMSMSDKTISILDRATHSIERTIATTDMTFCSYLEDSFRPTGCTGTLFGMISNDQSARVIMAHLFTFKSAARLNAPITLRAIYQEAQKLRETLGHYDLYLQKAREASEVGTDDDEKMGEVLGQFLGVYVGAVPVSSDSGIGPAAVDTAVQMVRARLAQLYAKSKRRRSSRLPPSPGGVGDSNGENVMLVVSSEGITTTETNTGETLTSIFIDNICYTSVAQTDQGKEIFAIICQDERLNTLSCHLYDMGSPRDGKAREICLLIGAAFQVAAKESEVDNPFKAVSSMSSESFPGQLDAFFLNRRKLSAVKVIGTGTFGKVFLANLSDGAGQNESVATEPAEDKPVAVKLLRGGVNTAVKADFLREAAIMAELQHANTCRLLGVCIQQRPWLCVLEFVQYGDLREVLHALRDRKKDLTCAERLSLAVQISAGMNYVVQRRFCHRDLASRNCLLHEDNVVKIADFGLSREFDAGKDYYLMRQGARLPMKWTDPSGVLDKRFGEFTDMWSFGVTLWELFTNASVPYDGVPNTEIQKRLNNGLRLSQPEGCPDTVFAVIYRCWAEHGSRWTFAGIDQELRTMLEGGTSSATPRDIGRLLNADYTDKVRRMTQSVSTMKRPSAARRAAAKAAAAKKNLEDATTGTPATVAGAGTTTDADPNAAGAVATVPSSTTDGTTLLEDAETVGSVGEEGNVQDGRPVRSPHLTHKTGSAVFEELQLSSVGDGASDRVRMQSISLAARPRASDDFYKVSESTTSATPNATGTTSGVDGAPPGTADDATEDGRLQVAEIELDVATDGAASDVTVVTMPVPARGLEATTRVNADEGVATSAADGRDPKGDRHASTTSRDSTSIVVQDVRARGGSLSLRQRPKSGAQVRVHASDTDSPGGGSATTAAPMAVLTRAAGVDDVVAWLRQVLPENFTQYDAVVRDNSITGARLAACGDVKTARALLGVKSIGHFLKIKKDLKEILDSSPVASTLLPSTTSEPGSSATEQEDPPRPTRVAPRAEDRAAPVVVEDRSNKSKIWLALNPAPLAAETDEERTRRENDKRIVGVGVNSTRGIGGLAPQTVEDLDVDGLLGPREQENADDLHLTSSDEEDEEDDDDFDPNRLELDDLGLGQLEQRRREREEAEKVRQAELRAKHLARQQLLDASREELQLKINRDKEEEQRKRDAEIDQVVESANKRLSQLRFSFSFREKKEESET